MREYADLAIGILRDPEIRAQRDADNAARGARVSAARAAISNGEATLELSDTDRSFWQLVEEHRLREPDDMSPLVREWIEQLDAPDYAQHYHQSAYENWIAPTLTTAPTASSLYADVGAVLNGDAPTPPRPNVGTRSDGAQLLYRGKVNVLIGNPESAKTLAATAIAAEELLAGRSVLVIDLDHNGLQETVVRFRSFGVSAATLSDLARFRYADPEDKDHLLAIVKDAETWRPDFVIVDSMGELIPLFGGDSNSADEFTAINRATLAKLARGGACVVAIDHLAKNTDSAKFGATGSIAKKRAVDGAMIRFTVQETFVPGQGGRASMTIVKDRHGGLRKVSVKGGAEMRAASFQLIERDGATNWKFWAPDGAPEVDAAQTDVEILAALKPSPVSVADVKARLNWGTTRASVALRAFRGEAEE